MFLEWFILGFLVFFMIISVLQWLCGCHCFVKKRSNQTTTNWGNNDINSQNTIPYTNNNTTNHQNIALNYQYDTSSNNNDSLPTYDEVVKHVKTSYNVF